MQLCLHGSQTTEEEVIPKAVCCLCLRCVLLDGLPQWEGMWVALQRRDVLWWGDTQGTHLLRGEGEGEGGVWWKWVTGRDVKCIKRVENTNKNTFKKEALS